MSTIKEVQSFDTILEDREEIIQLMSGLRQVDPLKDDYILVDFSDFSLSKVKLTQYEKSCFDNSLNYLVYDYEKLSILHLCRLKIYYMGIELFLPPKYISRAVNIWLSWVQYMPMSTAFSLLNMDISAIFSSIRN